MKQVRGRFLGVLATAGLVVLPGCGEGPPPVSSSTAEATIKGTVTVNGKLQKEGTLTFDPTNATRPNVEVRKAKINPDGTYSVTTVAGENRIEVVSRDVYSDPKLQGQTLLYDAKAGENSYDIKLPED